MRLGVDGTQLSQQHRNKRAKSADMRAERIGHIDASLCTVANVVLRPARARGGGAGEGQGRGARARGRGEVDVRQVEAHLLPVKDCEIVVSQESPSVSLRAEGRPKDDDIF